MNERILETLKAIQGEYGDAVFYNLTTVRNLMNDLAPNMRKERIQILHFLEAGGYFQLKYAGNEYPVVRMRLEKQLMETFAVDEATAMWVLNVFSVLLGYNINDDGAIYSKDDKMRLPRPEPIRETASSNVRPYIGNERRPLMTLPRTGTLSGKTKKNTSNFHVSRRISADLHSVAVLQNGLVMAAGVNSDGQCFTNTYDWRDIVAVSAGAYYTVGLRADGTAVATGRNDFGQLGVKFWNDISTVSAGVRHTVGLRRDGTLMACGQNKHGQCSVTHWRNLVHVVAGYDCTFGIKKDGKVLVSGVNKDGSLDVSRLEGVVDIAYGAPGRILALLNDGTIARVGRENQMRRNFSRFKNVKQISASVDYFAGLMEDGTVKILAYFWQDSGVEAATTDWTDIIAIAAGRYHILGWKSDGSLVAEMLHPGISKNKGQLNVTKWQM